MFDAHRVYQCLVLNARFRYWYIPLSCLVFPPHIHGVYAPSSPPSFSFPSSRQWKGPFHSPRDRLLPLSVCVSLQPYKRQHLVLTCVFPQSLTLVQIVSVHGSLRYSSLIFFFFPYAYTYALSSFHLLDEVNESLSLCELPGVSYVCFLCCNHLARVCMPPPTFFYPWRFVRRASITTDARSMYAYLAPVIYLRMISIWLVASYMP